MDSNDRLVDSLVKRSYIETEKVEAAFRAVDRSRFVPESHRRQAYNDVPLPISEEATISAPSMVAISTELLDVGESDRVLEIGSGSGYQVAILSELTDKEVVGVEIDERLVEYSRERLKGRSNVKILYGSGFDLVEGDFDRILYSCAVESLEPAREHLKENGLAVAPVFSDGSQILKKLEDGEITDHGGVRFVPFKEKEV